MPNRRGMVREYDIRFLVKEASEEAIISFHVDVRLDAIQARFVASALGERWINFVNARGGDALLATMEGDPLAFLDECVHLSALQPPLDNLADQIYDAMIAGGLAVENGGDEVPVGDWLSAMVRGKVNDGNGGADPA